MRVLQRKPVLDRNGNAIGVGGQGVEVVMIRGRKGAFNAEASAVKVNEKDLEGL